MDSLANPTLVQIIIFLTVAGSLIVLSLMRSGRERLIEARVRELGGRANDENNRKQSTSAARGLRLEAFLLSNVKRREHLQARFLEAGIYEPWALSIYVASRFALMLAFPGVCFACAHFGRLPWQHALFIAGPAAALGVCLPHMWLEHRRARRHLVLRRAIPDFLDLIVACMAGGLSFQAALRQVADELKLAHTELSLELSIVLREIELGGTLDHALQQLAARTGLDELRTLRSFVQQTTKLGTTITDALEQMADMLRTQRGQCAEELAQKAVVKILFPTLLFIFPTVFVVLAGPAAIQIKEGLTASTQHESAAE